MRISRNKEYWEELAESIPEQQARIKELREQRKAITRQIKKAQTQLAKTKKAIYNHEQTGKTYDEPRGLALELFGKHYRDMTPDEKREYCRIKTRQSRERLKQRQNNG